MSSPASACGRMLLGCVAVAMLAATAVRAQSYPTAPVKVLVPFAAGGATDVLARVFWSYRAAAWRFGVTWMMRLVALWWMSRLPSRVTRPCRRMPA